MYKNRNMRCKSCIDRLLKEGPSIEALSFVESPTFKLQRALGFDGKKISL